jgi:hypothetical protein
MLDSNERGMKQKHEKPNDIDSVLELKEFPD